MSVLMENQRVNRLLVSLFFLVIALVASNNVVANTENILHGRHLRILLVQYTNTLTVVRNATGDVIGIEGQQKPLLESLSQHLRFTYSFLNVPYHPKFDDTPTTTKGIVTFLNNNEADFALSTLIATPARSKVIDFPENWFAGDFSTLVPYPRERLNIAASFMPFSLKVWIVTVVSIFSMIVTLQLLNATTSMRLPIEESNSSKHYKMRYIQFVLGNIISQGQFCPSSRLKIRIAAGAWCCTCFFLVQSYCCTLTSHLTRPNQKTIVNSVFDVPHTPGIGLVTNRDQSLDISLQAAETTSGKRLNEILRKDSSNLCNKTSDCVEKVRQGSTVYFAPTFTLKIFMVNEMKTASSCEYTLLKETFYGLYAYCVLRKNSPYTEPISRGIQRMKAAGLIDHWETWSVPQPQKCMEINRQDDKRPLSLVHLSSAFVILIAGCVVSIMAFVFEIMITPTFCMFTKRSRPTVV